MNELIKVADHTVGEDTIQTVNARDLHAFLEVGKVFAAWIQDRISQYGFVENEDFVVFSNSGNNPGGGRPPKDYAISLDMAKELSMVERNAKGKQARQYFIDCERRAKVIDPVAVLNDPAAMRGLLLSYSEKVIALEAENKQMKPKVDALDRIATAEGSHCIRDSAKILQLRPIDLTRWLQANHWIYRRAGCGPWLGYQDKIQLGYLEHKVTIVTRSDGSDKVTEQVRITPMGLTRLSARISDEALIGSQVSPGGKRRITRPAYRPSAI